MHSGNFRLHSRLERATKKHVHSLSAIYCGSVPKARALASILKGLLEAGWTAESVRAIKSRVVAGEDVEICGRVISLESLVGEADVETSV